MSAADRWQAVLDAPMEELELGVRAYNMLKRRGYDTCGQVLRLDLEDAATWGGDDGMLRLGSQALHQIREAQAGLRSMRIQLQTEDEEEHMDGQQNSGLTEEQKMHVLNAATAGIIDLMMDDLELARRIGGDDFTRIFLAGVNAGVDAFDRVLTVGLRDFPA